MIKFIAQIKNGKMGFLSKYNKARFEKFKEDNDGTKVEIKPVSSKVSDEMRGYYWGALIPFIKNLTPYWKELTREQMHEVLKQEFNGFEVEYPTGVRKYGQSVCNKEIDTPKFQNFLLRVVDYVDENFNQELPDPEEYKKFRDGKQEQVDIEYPESQGEVKF